MLRQGYVFLGVIVSAPFLFNAPLPAAVPEAPTTHLSPPIASVFIADTDWRYPVRIWRLYTTLLTL